MDDLSQYNQEDLQVEVNVFKPTLTQEYFLRDTYTPIISFRSAVNQGKSSCLPAKAMYNAQRQHPDAQGRRFTEVLIIRGTQTQLLDTTVKSVREWLSAEDLPIRESPPIKGEIKGMPCNDQDQYFPMTMTYKDNAGREVESPYLLGAAKSEETGLYEGGRDVSGERIGDIFPEGTFIWSNWRFMAADSPNWEKDLLSTNFSFCLIDEADKVDELEKKLPVIAGRLGRAPRASIAPCTSKQIAMCYNPPDEGHFLEITHRTGHQQPGTALYEMPPPIIKIDNPEDPDDFVGCTYQVNPDAEGLHFAEEGAAFWLDKAIQFSHDSHYIQRSLLGICPPAGGGGKRVYKLFKAQKHIANLKASHRLKLVVSCDWANTPCACFIQWDAGLRVVDELYEDEMLSPLFIRNELMPYIKSNYGNHDVVITGDPTGSTISGAATDSVFDIFTMAGYETVENLTNDKELRWDAVNYYLAHEGGFLIDPKCERLVEGFNSGYIMSENAAKQGKRQAQKTGPSGKFSHLQDALQAGALYFRGGWEYRAEANYRNGGDRYETEPAKFAFL